MIPVMYKNRKELEERLKVAVIIECWEYFHSFEKYFPYVPYEYVFLL